ncbi:pyridoxamine 5'-phosphate oxidase family protein [Sphingomonas naphthae]|uniref:Pyridoxamine 5'-phosphate oxidase family protein n=1 Tax=Sphingomonas naphthae TaxID=1813468 RepID=A0ABY7TFV2_9SPHN|nr:pyridoxamine 5'-phosphate oxidase family protein [Sphingomonas naphthae]WCT72093.1 pyridoxamine 5'-phosphate oxidase family protein [Sphingomonas naphthae]
MATDAEIEGKFWSALKSAPNLMLGLDGARDGHTQPMTAQFEGEHGPIWFFTTKDNTLVAALGASHRAIASYTGKGHDLFATLHGTVTIDNDAATIDRLWSKEIEAWYPAGKADPSLTLLRLDPDKSTFWLNGSSIGAAISKLFGNDPKEGYKDNMATVALA